MADAIEVQPENKGVRVDKFLVGQFTDKTRGEIIRMINAEVVLIGGKKVKPSYKLKGTEIIEIGEYDESNDKIALNRNIILDIVENNDDFVVIDKQRGLQIHPSHREREETLVNALLYKFSEIAEVGDDPERPGIVHRLDKDTTGLLVVAKNQKTFDELKTQFQDRLVQKTYHALVFGLLDEKEGIVDAPIARATSYTKQKIAFGKYKGDSKEAQTEYKVLDEFIFSHELTFSLVELRPKTGRTHQIRVHMAHIGHPLVGDERYYTKNEKKLSLHELKEYNPNTFYLHAKELAFTLNGQEHKFNAKYPERFNALLQHIKK
ncbi:MAG: RluA family pseudouridine synthase [Patescibacteria group bacterium]